MATMIVKHTVNNFDAWKKAYDEFEPSRREWGVTGAGVYRDTSNPNVLFITHQFNNVEAAMEFAGSEDLKSAMANAGVVGHPDITFCEDVEQTTY